MFLSLYTAEYTPATPSDTLLRCQRKANIVVTLKSAQIKATVAPMNIAASFHWG